MEKDFIVGISFQIDEKKFYICTDFSRFFDPKTGSFDEKRFYQDNYVLLQAPESDEAIVWGDQISEVRYLYCSQVVDLRKIPLDVYKEDKNNQVFFIDGGTYDVYDQDKQKIGVYHEKEKEYLYLHFHRRETSFGISSFLIGGAKGTKVNFILYPSKIPSEAEVIHILKRVDEYYPKSWSDEIREKFSISLSQTYDTDFKSFARHFGDTAIYSESITKPVEIPKRDYKPHLHIETEALIDLILEKGDFDALPEDQLIEVKRKQKILNNKKNNYILHGLIFARDELGVQHFDEIIMTYQKAGIQAHEVKGIPDQLWQDPTESRFVRIIEKCKKHPQRTFQLSPKDEKDFHWVKGLNDIYEVYCFIKFYEFLRQIGIDFADDLNSESIYDAESQILIKYQDYFPKGFITGSFHSQPCTLYFGDKIIPNHLRKYQLMLKSDFNFLDRAFKKASERDGLTPDITLEIGDELIICDVKFSCFKDRETQLDFPNFDRLLELQKYRKIFVKGNPYSKPIILFYPGSIKGDTGESSNPKPPTPMQRLENFKLMHALVLSSFQIFLFPILDDDETPELFSFLKEEFEKIL